jgi:hypothetical protein
LLPFGRVTIQDGADVGVTLVDGGKPRSHLGKPDGTSHEAALLHSLGRVG